MVNAGDVRKSLNVKVEVSFAHFEPVNKLDHLLVEQKLEDDIAQAFVYVKENVSTEPLGITVPLRNVNAPMSDGLLMSGTLAQLDLSCSALKGCADGAKIRHVLMEGRHMEELRSQIGTIIVNTITSGGKVAGLGVEKLQRANKDGEVQRFPYSSSGSRRRPLILRWC